MNPKVDWFFEKESKWQNEYRKLRSLVLKTLLDEELKWGNPCYSLQKANVVLIHGFKEYCALLFFKGALLKDENKILIQQTENVQSARQMRFTSEVEIEQLSTSIEEYIYEAIEVEKAGLKVELKKTSEFPVSDELQEKLANDSNFKAAFEALTPGRRRGYLLYFSQAKQSTTRISRIEKCVEKIYAGKGWNEEN